MIQFGAGGEHVTLWQGVWQSIIDTENRIKELAIGGNSSHGTIWFRSAVALQIPDCQAGVRDQVNVLTSWLDNSNVYGSNQADTNDIRWEEYLDFYCEWHSYLCSRDARSPLLKNNPRLTRIRGRGIPPSCQTVRAEAVSCQDVSIWWLRKD